MKFAEWLSFNRKKVAIPTDKRSSEQTVSEQCLKLQAAGNLHRQITQELAEPSSIHGQKFSQMYEKLQTAFEYKMNPSSTERRQHFAEAVN